jgi:hypothetical protein
VAASVSLRVCTGTGAATESAAQTGLALMDIDSAANDPDANQVAPGANSYEKWVRLAIDDSDGLTVSGFWVERSGDLDDGVVIKVGYAATGATPKATTSTVATETMHSGRRYWFDMGEYDTNGDRTTYLVLQEQVAATVTAGQIDQQVFQFGWSAA